MSESHLPKSMSSTHCPACKKVLLTRSARLCLFCGEKLPEDLLVPLSEVQREEQRSQEKTKRVNDAFEQREAAMLERSRHLTPTGALFGSQFKRVDEQFGEMLFPEVDSDAWALHEFSRTLKLPDDDFDARRHKRDLDEGVRKLASKVAAGFGRMECKVSADQAGHLSVKLMDNALTICIQTQFGTNATFNGGVSQSFCSYTIRAEGRVLALNKADGWTRWVKIACMTAGVVGIPVGLVWFAYTLARSLGLEMLHRLWLNEMGIALAFLLGAWVGGKVGRALAAIIEKHTFRRAEAEGVIPRMESLWDGLTERIAELTREYEMV
jgi:hypothetical protein